MAAVQESLHTALPQGPCTSKPLSIANVSNKLFEALANVKLGTISKPAYQHQEWSAKALTGIWSSTPEEIVTQVDASTWQGGALLLPDLGLTPPWQEIRALFDYLSSHPEVVLELNSLYPFCNIVKDAASDVSRADADVIDQKVAFDLNAQRLAALKRVPNLEGKLGAPFQTVLTFFQEIEQKLIANIMDVVSIVSGQDLTACHTHRNNNFRINDYPARFPDDSAKNAAVVRTETLAHSHWCSQTGRACNWSVEGGEAARFRNGVTSSELKEATKRKWKAREGTLGRDGGREAGSQDEVIDQFMRLPEAV